jgi:hypothetical protein
MSRRLLRPGEECNSPPGQELLGVVTLLPRAHRHELSAIPCFEVLGEMLAESPFFSDLRRSWQRERRWRRAAQQQWNI